jgi:hypothetical protein
VSSAADENDSVDVALVNSDGAPVCISFDNAHSKTRKVYCGRKVGQEGYLKQCSQCDGRCGPTNGCQCKSCIDYEASREVFIPFPELSNEMAERLACVAGSDLCGGTMRKQIQRVLSTLSLYDENWKVLMHELSKIGSRLSGLSIEELQCTHTMLKGVAAAKGDASYGIQ